MSELKRLYSEVELVASKPGNEQLVEWLESGEHSSVMFLVGSSVSCSEMCKCTDVTTIRNEMVLDPIKASHSKDLGRLIERMFGESPLAASIKALPFEQFMGCLDAVSHEAAAGIIEAGCGGSLNSKPGANHELIASIASALLDRGLCRSVTVATTNYDRCLEGARSFEQLGATKRVNPYVVAREMPIKKGRLSYVKLHGCVSEPGACIYTMKQYAEALVDPKYKDTTLAELGAPSLVICIGYSFSDPDIRSILQELKRRGTMFFRNERPGYDTGSTSSSPPDVLKREFLKEIQIVTYESDLFQNPDEHILHYIATKLGLDSQSVGLDEYCPTTDASRNAVEAVKALSLSQSAEVLARICSSCCRGDAAREIAKVIRPKRENGKIVAMPLVRPVGLRLLLEQFGHRHEMRRQARAAHAVRVRYGSAHEIVGRSIESFALSLRGSGKQLWPAWRSLRVRKSSIEACDSHTRELYEHYRAHLYCKVIQKANSILPRLLLRTGGRSLLKWRAKRWIEPLLSAVKRVEELTSNPNDSIQFIELRDLADAHLLAAQMLLLAEDTDSAETHARRAEIYYSCAGFLNGALQANRALSWIYLVRGDRANAVRMASLGLWRALETDDISLRPKLAVDVLRSLGHAAIQVSARFGLGVEEKARTAAAALAVGEAADVGAIQEYVGVLYPRSYWRRLQRNLLRSLDVKLYPLILPLDPPVPFRRSASTTRRT